jgi:peptidoglycan hydrolase-like protein with peptidoglycan-binding domain
VDGIFGASTKAAVAKFQASRQELKGDADGAFGPKTWAILLAS